MTRLERSLAALPDTGAAAVFLSAWIAPLWWHAGLVRALLLVMLVEFILIHAGVFLRPWWATRVFPHRCGHVPYSG